MELDLKERIELVMREKQWDIATVARVCGVSHSAVSQWLGRGAKPTSKIGNAEAAENLARASGYKALWLATGKGPKTDSAPPRFSIRQQDDMQAIGEASPHSSASLNVVTSIQRIGDLISSASPGRRSAILALLAEYDKNPERVTKEIEMLLGDSADDSAIR